MKICDYAGPVHDPFTEALDTEYEFVPRVDGVIV